MGVNKFDASGLSVQMDATLMGQGVNGPAMGLQAPAIQDTSPQISRDPIVSLAGPGGR
jgi:hypothetical protein